MSELSNPAFQPIPDHADPFVGGGFYGIQPRRAWQELPDTPAKLGRPVVTGRRYDLDALRTKTGMRPGHVGRFRHQEDPIVGLGPEQFPTRDGTFVRVP